MQFTFTQMLEEKMGIISRVDQLSDVLEISEITKNFMDDIIKTPNKSFETYQFVLDQSIQFSYIPTIKPNTKGEAINGNHIKIYLQYNKHNYLDIKYIVIHELIHIIQQIRATKHYKEYTTAEKIKFKLRRPGIQTLNKLEKSKYFLYLIYREDIYEITAWGNNAYLNAFKLKMKYPNMTNNDICKRVLSLVNMNTSFLNASITNIRKEDIAYIAVICMLISQFSELSKRVGQNYFDKHIFQLDVIKKIRMDVKSILSEYNDVDDIVAQIANLYDIYEEELQENKTVIIESFITHIKYWFNRAQLKIGKAIQLGIDDATIKNNKTNNISCKKSTLFKNLIS